jgi:hypothetical protein
LIAVIKPVLPQLVSFTMSDGEKPTGGTAAQQPRAQGTYVETALNEMSRMRYLTIGLDGFDTANLFPLLTELKELRHFTLRQWTHSPQEKLDNFETHAPALLSFIEACSSTMTTISLPLVFDDTIFPQLEQAAQKEGIKLVWVF